MICPRCSTETLDGAVDCPACGIIFAKWRAPRTAPARREAEPAETAGGDDAALDIDTGAAATAAPVIGPGISRPQPWSLREPPKPPEPEYLGVTHAGWKATGIGLVMALALTFFPFLNFILSPLSTLVHEVGHAAMYWLFGYSAIPAFDFGEGGGVTMTDGIRSPLIVAAWVLGAIVLGWRKRDRPVVLGAIIGMAVVYFIAFNGSGEALATTLGGHGGEIVFGTVFIYRALTGWGCQIELERPLYSFLGFKIILASVHLGTSLLTDITVRTFYLQGKRGIDNDLMTGAMMLGWRLESMARLLVILSALAVPLAVWAASVRKTIGAVSEAEEEV